MHLGYDCCYEQKSQHLYRPQGSGLSAEPIDTPGIDTLGQHRAAKVLRAPLTSACRYIVEGLTPNRSLKKQNDFTPEIRP